MTADGIRPVLKWAGGKRQLLPHLRKFYPGAFGRYYEPFVGSAAVFLDLYNLDRLERAAVHLSDINADVIGCYRMIRDRVEDVIASLRSLQQEYERRGPLTFYDVRDREFNPARRDVHRAADPSAAYTPALAAMLVFLNRTGYNGLFRVNARGDFNVPAGRFDRPLICDAENLRRLSAAFRHPGVTFAVRDFDAAVADAGEGDFVYLDPPYAPLTGTARFTSYTAGGFGAEQQEALQRRVVALARRGAHVLLSNSSARQIRDLYARNDEVRAAGLTARVVPARRAINSRASRRGPVGEYLITNVACA
jgi:DNA adenine methylase